jgi:glutamate racemase
VDSNRPIGVFDSGVGGLSVARELLRGLPDESIAYYADTVHVPYGGRPLDEVRGFALHIVDFLIERGAKMIVMACNISSAIAVESARQVHPDIPILGVLRPGARAACATGAERIGVLATQGTVLSGAYERALRDADKGISVLQVACPLFVPLVESGETESPAAIAACRIALAPMAAHPACEAIILGCTHYPFLLSTLKRTAEDLFERPPIFVDPAAETVRSVFEALQGNGMSAMPGASPAHRFYASGDPEQFRSHASLFLGADVVSVEQGT